MPTDYSMAGTSIKEVALAVHDGFVNRIDVRSARNGEIGMLSGFEKPL
jgi:hypothetical protein